MVNIRNLQDSELLEKTRNLVAHEKETTLEVLHHLREIETRKLYLKEGFDSLFEFCTRELHYSEGSASRRISSMRLLRDIPQVGQMLRENKVNLSTLSILQSHIRKEEKAQKTKIAKLEKLDLLAHIENKSQEACQRELLKQSSRPIKLLEWEKILDEDLTEIKFVASKELMEKFKALKNLTAHSLPTPTWNEFFEFISEIAMKKLDPRVCKSTAAAAKHGVTKVSRYIPKRMRQLIWMRDNGRCQFVSQEGGRKCGSSFALQIDHIHPFALGGETKEENLRLLCRPHNALVAEQVFGPPPKSV